MKSCPACAEQIQDAALKCRFCGEIVRTHQSLEPIETVLPKRSKLAYWARLLGCIPFMVMGVIGLMLGLPCASSVKIDISLLLYLGSLESYRLASHCF